MKIQLLSDLHFEFMDDHGDEFLKSLKGEADVLVLAGDIVQIKDHYDVAEKVFKCVADTYKHVIYVPGNHEYYFGKSKDQTERDLTRILAPYDNVHRLDCSSVVIDGQTFIGGTGWFSELPDTTYYHKNCMSDFSTIRDIEKFAYSHNSCLYNYLQKNMTLNDILVTHHLPHKACVSPRFKISEINRFFLCQLDSLIDVIEPKMCLYGHTHEPTNFTIGKTQFICNPKGYPGEKASSDIEFDDNLIIEV